MNNNFNRGKVLNFEDANSKQRKFQCFVCGINHESLETMKDHVKDKHEQGREWLECPECKYPVRCMKTHFKVKHPKRVMPKGLQTRVAVWKDFKPSMKDKDGKPKKVVKKPPFRQGTFVSAKCGKDFEYKSGIEEEFYNMLEADIDVVSWAYEPFKVPYFWKGEWHNYKPDLKVCFADGTIQIWEIKPANQTHYEQNKAKWASMNNFAENMGWEFIVMTEVGLGKLRQKISQQKLLLDQRKPEEPKDSAP